MRIPSAHCGSVSDTHMNQGLFYDITERSDDRPKANTSIATGHSSPTTAFEARHASRATTQEGTTEGQLDLAQQRLKKEYTEQQPSATEEVQQTSVCQECPKFFRSEQSLKRHRREKHGAGATWPCATCGRRFLRKETRKRHINEVHRQLDRIECSRCYKFVVGRHLKEHKKAQTCISMSPNPRNRSG